MDTGQFDSERRSGEGLRVDPVAEPAVQGVERRRPRLEGLGAPREDDAGRPVDDSRVDERARGRSRALGEVEVVAVPVLGGDVSKVGALVVLDVEVAEDAEDRGARRRDLVEISRGREAVVRAVEALLDRDFGWARTWAAQLAQCERDAICRVSLIPPRAF